MSATLRDQIEPFRLAQEGCRLGGEIALSRMRRLRPSLAGTSGTVHAELGFGVDGQGVPFVRGHVRARLQLICQRCMEPMEVVLETRVALGITRQWDDARVLAGDYEPLVVEGEAVSLAEIVEDELILALPVVPKHALEECPASVLPEAEPEDDGTQSDGRNPFAVLARLKDR